MRLACKWLLGISIGMLIALVLFTIFSWALFGASAMFFQALTAESGNTSSEGLSLTDYFSDFMGSPMFYMYLVDVFVLLGSSVALLAMKHPSKS